uniref:SCP domain-containing protein n=1 Tax=Glossina palpalis gambiensis TaxID=67801 RepID=A0A1B0AQI0_9MUSC
MFCVDQPHTLCVDFPLIHLLNEMKDEHYLNMKRKNCSNEGQRLDKKDYLKMKRQLIIGHNGLRNRIAGVMRVANMMELIWNDDLALMAERHIYRCTPYDDDICTRLNQSLEYEKTHFHLKGKEMDSFCKVSQNRYYQKNVHYPNIIVENALRTWYREKFGMEPPKEAFDETHMRTNGYLKGENNFTHLAYPLAAFFGCSMNKVYDGFLLLCNYHPYERSGVVDFEFIKGNPGEHCPITRPLKNTYENFANLCIGFPLLVLL